MSRTRPASFDSLERKKFVKAILDLTEEKDNMGWSPDEFFTYLDKCGIPPKCKKGKVLPDRRNDLLTTTQKAAQDWGIIFYHTGKKGMNQYFVDNRVARFRKLTGRRPDDAIIYSGSKRGFKRRLTTKKHMNVSDFYKLKKHPVVLVEDEVHIDRENSVEVEAGIEVEEQLAPNSPLETIGTVETIHIDMKPMVDPHVQPDYHQHMNENANIQMDEDNSEDDEFLEEMDDIDELIANDDPLEVLDQSANFYIDECINTKGENFSNIEKYTYESRFYLVSTFLEREKFISDFSLSSLMKFNQEKLANFNECMEAKYQDINIRDQYDNSAVEYCCALNMALKFPTEISQEDLPKYWEICSEFHGKKLSDRYLLEKLNVIRPLYMR